MTVWSVDLPAGPPTEALVFAICVVFFSPSSISCATIMYILRDCEGALYLTFYLNLTCLRVV